MNEPAIRMEEQIISLFPDRETLICRGWVLKRMERQLLVYPLYYKCSILTDNGYGLEKCGVVGECSLTGDAGKLCMKGKMQGGLFLKNRNGGTEYVMAGEMAVGIKRQGLLFLPDGNLSDTGLEDILRFAAANGIVKILADIPGGGGGRTAGAVWAAGLLQGLSLPPLSEKSGGEILSLFCARVFISLYYLHVQSHFCITRFSHPI